MEKYFEDILGDYREGELTVLFLHDRKTGNCYNLLTLIELIPAEQPASPLIGSDKTSFLDRENIDANATVYIGRMTGLTVNDTYTFFEQAEQGLMLENEGTDKKIDLFPGVKLTPEPNSAYPIIVDKQTERSFGPILPNRPTDLRVWAKLDMQKQWLTSKTGEDKKKMLDACAKLSLRHLGFDLSKLAEHLGNTYLFGCNPFIRYYKAMLLDHDRELVIEFMERSGMTMIGKTMVLEEVRAGNSGFSVRKEITAATERIRLPHFPDSLVTKLYDANGYLLENHLGTWVNFSMNIQMQESVLNLQYDTDDGPKTLEVPKYSSERAVDAGSYNHAPAHFLKSNQRGREIAQLEENKEFVFFPGGPSDKIKAHELIDEIVNRASKRCVFLDPYFSRGDLRFAFVIRQLSVPIRIISSAVFLREKVELTNGDAVIETTRAAELQEAVDDYKKKYPRQSMEVKVLRGKKSPLHDRYIIVDDSVYLLGSSFNEFGSRATTLYKVPMPDLMIEQAETWWSRATNCVSLDDFIKLKTTGDEIEDTE